MRPYAILFAAMLAWTLAVVGTTSIGCSSSSAKPAVKDAGPSDGSNEADAGPMLDAGPDVEQDPNVYPAKHHPIPQVDNLGGPVLTSPVIVTITFNYVVADAGQDTGTVLDSSQPDSTLPDAADAMESGPTEAGGEGGSGEAGAVDAGPADSGSVDSAVADSGGPVEMEAGPDPLAATFEHFGDVITGTPWWNSATGAYGVGPGKNGGHIRLPDSLGPGMGTISNSSIDDSAIQAFIQQEITANLLPPPTSNTIYAFYFPSTTTVVLQGSVSCQSFGGYHGSAAVTDTTGASLNVAYAVINRCSFGGGVGLLDQTTISASHEFAEACSDPGPGLAYYMVSNDAWSFLGQGTSGGEIGDLCNNATQTAYHAAGYSVQRIWSNKAAALSEDPCQPTDDYPQPYIYFNAAVDTQSVMGMQGKADGYLPVKRGTTGTFNVTIFSTGPLQPLGSQLSFAVGVPPNSFGSNPAILGSQDAQGNLALSNGTTGNLSLTTGVNGNAATLSLTVPANAPTSPDINFVVRSTLMGTTTYHDWPVILRVTK
jgi:hypothetical protein